MPASRHVTWKNAPKLLARIGGILSLFCIFVVKKCWGDLCLKVMCISNPRSFTSKRKNLRVQHPLRVEIWSSEKVALGWVEMRQLNFLVSGIRQFFFVQRGRDCTSYIVREVTPPDPEVVGAQTLNFKPIFECSFF